ncbi:hypothetical protein Ddye_017404 [Dipteronia dyeriana]|uniref:NAC domain-containing protein n=1 Tax=Dipteronia dyeriana TaxID=168575 RepID=A0AAD9U9M3_9ROSI|nr:hypothetical protein Ddye_017404 [Dipteronia dyeriana]
MHVCMYAEQAAWRSNDPVWFFFGEPDYKYANSRRVNRKTKAGYWKPTGADRTIKDMQGREIGIKKNLVFRLSSSNKGDKTHWVMHEYHSNNARFYPKPFVLFRLKRKSDDDGSDTCDGPSHQLTSQSQGNHQLPEREPLSNVSEQDYGPAAQGPSYSSGCNYQINTGRSHTINSSYSTEQDDQEFVNSLWADREGEYSFEETVNTCLHEFNPPRSLRQVYAGDSSYANAETVYSQWANVLETPSFLSGNFSSKKCRQIHMGQAPQSKKPRINCIQLVSEEFPVVTTCEAQHLPKSHNIEKKSAPVKVYLQGKVSSKAVSRDEVRIFETTALQT